MGEDKKQKKAAKEKKPNKLGMLFQNMNYNTKMAGQIKCSSPAYWFQFWLELEI